MNDTAQYIIAFGLCALIICFALFLVALVYQTYVEAKCKLMTDADYHELRRLKEIENNLLKKGEC